MAATTAGAPAVGAATRLRGRVRWFSHKGFGFIAGADGRDVYVHHSVIVGTGFRTLPTDAEVTYSVRQTARGPEAIDVVVDD